MSILYVDWFLNIFLSFSIGCFDSNRLVPKYVDFQSWNGKTHVRSHNLLVTFWIVNEHLRCISLLCFKTYFYQHDCVDWLQNVLLSFSIDCIGFKTMGFFALSNYVHWLQDVLLSVINWLKPVLQCFMWKTCLWEWAAIQVNQQSSMCTTGTLGSACAPC